MKLALVAVEADGIVKIATTGDISAGDIPSDGPNPLEPLLGPTWPGKRIVLNFSKTGYLDSTAISWLIESNRAFRKSGGIMVAYAIQPAVLQILNILRVGKTVPLADTEESAIQVALRGPQPAPKMPRGAAPPKSPGTEAAPPP